MGVAIAVAFGGLVLSQWFPEAVLRAADVARIRLSLPEMVAVSTLATDLLGFGLGSVAYLRLRGRGIEFVHARRPTVGDVGWIVGGIVVVLVGYGVAVAGARLLGVRLAGSDVAGLGELHPPILVLLAVLSFLVIAPMEELFFRGLVQGTMREALAPTPAVIVASAAFAAVHVFSIQGSVIGELAFLGSLFVTSLVLGFAYERTDNLAVNVVIHGTYNAILLLGAYVLITAGIPLS